MKVLFATLLVCLSLVPLGCGGSDSATSAGGKSASLEKPTERKEAGSGQPTKAKVPLPPIGSYPAEGPFASISGGEGNEKPHIDPADRPPPKNPLVRTLERGSGPPAQLGDEIGMYFAGAGYDTGKVEFFGWPPAPTTYFELGSGTMPRLWELAFRGLREGGIREVVAPSRFFNGTGAVDYVMVLASLAPASGDQ